MLMRPGSLLRCRGPSLANAMFGDRGLLVPETPAAFPTEENPRGFEWLTWGLIWGLRRKFFQAVVCISLEQKKKSQQKESAGFAFIPPIVKQAGHMWGEEGGELMKLWVVMFKHLSWSCVANVHPFNGLHSCP